MMFVVISALLLTFVFRCRGAYDLGWDDDTDLTSFVTHPEIKAPKFSVKVYDEDRVSPGYWFIGPYAALDQREPSPRYYQACQTGPHIYDANGELVWSGACEVDNQNVCDFRAWNFNGTDYLSMILHKYKGDPTGRGAIMDNSYRFVKQVQTPSSVSLFNMHELNLVDKGKSALHFIHRTEFVNVSMIPDQWVDWGWIINMGFREVDVDTGETKFEWWAHPEVDLLESHFEALELQGPYPKGWNFFHGNSIAKNSDGDYLVSSRYTDTVFKISGMHGRIIWRLGGIKSNFELTNFNFSSQHDAQWIESECYGDQEMISLLDNGSDGFTKTSNTSSGLVIALNTTTMTATVVRRYERPDKLQSDLRGNFQHLPNGNVFASWSDNSYISEHTSDNDLVMEAQFSSQRFVTYRAFKMNFTGAPVSEPALKAFVYGVDRESSTTVCYVSWNGATEVVRWDFYQQSRDGVSATLIGSAVRSGFETQLQSKGFRENVFVEAVAANGSTIGRSKPYEVSPPKEWSTGMRDSMGVVITKAFIEEQQAVIGPRTEL